MSQDEQDAFEKHFFTCELCATDVRFTSTFVNTAKIVMADRPRPPAVNPLAWLKPQLAAPAFAAIALAVVAGYQNMVSIPTLKAPLSMGFAVILNGATRSSLPRVRAGQ